MARTSSDLSPPNPKIDAAIDSLMAKINVKKGEVATIPPDIAVKIINTAIAWEKVKHHIRDGPDNSFDPDGI